MSWELWDLFQQIFDRCLCADELSGQRQTSRHPGTGHGFKCEVIRYLTLKLDRVVAPPADLSPLTEIPPSPITEAVVEDDGISAEN